MEASALRHPGATGLRGPAPLFRLQSDERLIALVRRGNHAAFEALVGRYQARLLAFCRHMLASREDAEDVLQEVFAAAFNAILADNRPINARPWLYRIARNRSLNHLRRQQAIGVDSMDVHFAEGGMTTADKVHKREEFRALIGDVQELPETQKTALLLREIDALSYEQIAEAMETTVPSVKSLLVRARVSLAEMAEARKLTCEEVREELGEVAEGLRRTSAPVRRHLRSCDRCTNFRRQLKQTNRALAAIMPVAPLLLAKKLLLAQLGTTASAGGAAAGGAAAGGAVSAGISTVASKTACTIAAAAIVTAGAVEVKRAGVPVAHPPVQAAVAPVAAAAPAGPVVLPGTQQDTTSAAAVTQLKSASGDAAEKDEAAAPTDAAEPATGETEPTPATDPNAAMPTGGAQDGVDTVVLPGAQPGQPGAPGTGGTAAPPEEQPQQPQPQPQPQPGGGQPEPSPSEGAQPDGGQSTSPVVTEPVPVAATPVVAVPVDATEPSETSVPREDDGDAAAEPVPGDAAAGN